MDDTTLQVCRILILDDNAANVDQLEQLLEFNNFLNLESSTDPREFERLLEEFRPDLILLDLQMPHLDGFQILELLGDKVEKNDFLPVIVLTADVTPESQERALKLGAMDFLTKPFDFTEVILRVNNLLRTRQLHIRLRYYNDLLEERVKERTAKLKKAQDELVAQERFKAMGQMASGIAHDFNNTIAVMMGYSELLLAAPGMMEDREMVEKSCRSIRNAALDAASIVRRLREFYKNRDSEEDEAACGDLRTLAEEAISMTRPKWRDQALADGRSITIETELESAHVAMAPTKVREILTNLIFNAVDAMPDGGTITLRSSREQRLGCLIVQDTGAGMTEEVRRRCFETFFTTKGSKGTGLGLGTASEMVRQHRGQIAVESEPGQGSTFTIRLPLLSYAGLESDEAQSQPSVRPLNILVVDDEEDVREILENILTAAGHSVTLARDGQEGLVKFLADSIDLVITDLAMPHVSGAQLAFAIRKHAWQGPIIMLTGFGDELEGEDKVPAGVSIVLNKPVQIAKIHEAIQRLVAEM